MTTIKNAEWPTGNYEIYFIRQNKTPTQSCERKNKTIRDFSLSFFHKNLSENRASKTEKKERKRLDELCIMLKEGMRFKKILNSMLINLSTWHSWEHPIKRKALTKKETNSHLHFTNDDFTLIWNLIYCQLQTFLLN